MLNPRIVNWMFSIFMTVLYSGISFAQDYPNRPIRIVAPESAGGADVVARLIAQGLTGSLDQQVIVENRGGSVIIKAEIVRKASPDGYTLLLDGPQFWLLPFMQDKVPYDPVRDFSVVALPVSSPLVLVVHPSLAVKSVQELIALIKARPGEINYGSAPTGSSAHLGAELFKAMAGVDIVRISYKGTGPALNALIAGEVQLMFSTVGAVPHFKSGRLRALAVTSLEPSALFPGLPTVAASVPDFKATAIIGMFAPVGTPSGIVKRLNNEIVRVIKTPETKEKLFNAGVEIVGNSPEEFAAVLKSEMARMGKVIKDAGIRAD